MDKRALTLIELLVVISVSAVLVGLTAAVLKTGFDTYSFVQQETLLQKALDEALDEASGAGFRGYGIKDGLEILDVTPTSIAFVPMWVQEESAKEGAYFLSRPLRAGAPIPIAEALLSSGGRRKRWQQVPITFFPGKNEDPLKPDDRILLNQPLSPGTKIRFTFQPDAANFSDCAAFIGWQQERLVRTYKGVSEILPRFSVKGLTLSDFRLRYFDNTNAEVIPAKDNIPNITGVQINLTAVLSPRQERQIKPAAGNKEQYAAVSREGFTFINLRNTRTSGTGLLIHQGTKIKIADSRRTRMFSIANISGVKGGGTIELEARPKKGSAWKAVIELGLEADTPVIKKYSIEYPAGNRIYSQVVDLTADVPLNFMNLSSSASYGAASVAAAGAKTVDVRGDVELVVTRMDAKGAMLFIRP